MWSDIVGQKRIINILKNIYKNKKISHAYIFWGKEGTGKDAVALEFAKLINCNNLDSDLNPCGSCKYCRGINELYSSHFRLITALPSNLKGMDTKDELSGTEENYKVNTVVKKSEEYEIYLEELDKKKQNHYYKIVIPKANEILIDSIREIKRELQFTFSKGKYKVILISCADLMNAESSNALLKILEEPPENCLLLLTTSRVNSLLPTIYGRCQKIKFDSLQEKEIADYLIKYKPELDKEKALFYACISEGSISRAIQIADSYLMDLREDIINLLRETVRGKMSSANKIIESISKGKDRERINNALFIIMTWFRDANYYLNNYENKIINKDKIENIRRFCANYEFDFYKIIGITEDTIKELENNINPEILLNNYIYDVGILIREKKHL